MSGTTPRLGIYQMGGGLSGTYGPAEQVNVDKINEGFIEVDAAIGLNICTSTTRPAAPFPGQPIYETDTKNMLYWSTAVTRWIPIGVANVATLAARDVLFPAPTQDDQVYRADLGWEEVYLDAYNVTTNPDGATPAGWYRGLGGVTTRHRTTALNITNVLTTLDYETALAAPTQADFTYAAGVFTATRGGTYDIDATVNLAVPGGTVTWQASLYKNAVLERDAGLVTPTGAQNQANLSSSIILIPGDTVSVKTFANTAAGMDITARRTMISLRHSG